MEGKAHARQSYSAADEPSRIQEDLDGFSKDLSSSYQPRPTNRKKERVDIHVCIVGAGLAGLRCADILLQKGIKLTVLEARDHLGGRVSQDVLLGDLVDLGPNWIHGTTNNPILNLAKDTNTPLCLAIEDTLVYDETGVLLDKKKVEEYHEIVWSIISDAFRYSNQNSFQISPDVSLKDFFIEKLREMDLSHEDRGLVLQMGEVWGSFIGDSWEKQSLKYFWLEECLDGDNLYVASNHQAVISHVAKRALENADIMYNTRVIGVSQQGAPQNSKVKVQTDTDAYEFDEVVVAIPLGCLKHKHIDFQPSLPPSFTQALENTSYSRLEKVYITFPSAFWASLKPDTTESITRTNVPPTKIPEALTPEPNPPPNTELPSFSSFAHFLHPIYTHLNPDSWTIEVQPLSSKPLLGEHARPTLLFTIFGPCATHVTSLITSLDRTSPEYFAVLNAFFLPYYSLLPNYTPERRECQPRAILATNWHCDELAGYGTYTNFLIPERQRHGGQEMEVDEEVRLEDCFLELRRGLPDRGIWFAGEHTAPFVALGTLTGAYWSGEAVGMRILGAYGLVDDGVAD